MDHEKWMRQAFDEALAGIEEGQTPFGAVIVREGKVVARGHNEVWASTDPTAHAEVVAIRRGALAVGGIDLGGCVMYATCEPCPMCAAAIHWSKLDAVCFGAGISDAQAAGFSELAVPIYDLYASGKSRVVLMPRVMREECAGLFEIWLKHPAHRGY